MPSHLDLCEGSLAAKREVWSPDDAVTRDFDLLFKISGWQHRWYYLVGGRSGSGSNSGVAYHTDSPTEVEDLVFALGW